MTIKRTPITSSELNSNSLATDAISKEPAAADPSAIVLQNPENRKNTVLKLKLKGYSYNEIAELLQVSRATVARDLSDIKEENKDIIGEYDREQIIRETLSGYDDILTKAWSEYESSPKGSQNRLKALEVVRSIRNDKLRAMQDCGLIEVAADKVEYKVTANVENYWSNDEFRERAARAILEATLTSQLALPTKDYSDVIDVEPLNVTELTDKTDNKEEN